MSPIQWMRHRAKDTTESTDTAHTSPATASEQGLHDPDDLPNEVIYLAMGCFWGAEETLWERPDVVSTAVGYMGGNVANPGYELVCSGTTGHAETVRVEYDPDSADVADILQAFWEKHDPTTLDRQGNDVGSQYRSAIFVTNDTQLNEALRTRQIYQEALDEIGIGPIVTEILPASEAGPFYYAEEYHQKYLRKHPDGYRCGAATGVPYPDVNGI